MRALKGWAVLVGALTCGAACSGKQLHNLGDLNHESGGAGAANGGKGSGAGGTGVPRPPVPLPEGEGGASGTGGASDTCDAGSGCIFQAAETQLMALAADSSTLYWVEYGSFDELGNYGYDGRLMARDFDATTARVIATGLRGPVGVGVTSEHAFVYLDRGERQTQQVDLVRIPLAGGDAVPIKPGVNIGGYGMGSIVHDGGTAYFWTDSGIYRIAPNETEPTWFANIPGAMVIAGDSLYLDNVEGTYRIPLASGNAERIALPMRGLQASGDYLYALDYHPDEVIYLTRTPLAGGVWTRQPPQQMGDVGSYLQVSGDLFFYDLYRNPTWHLYQGNLADPAGAKEVLNPANDAAYGAWVGTSAGVFWIDSKGNRIRLRANAVP